MKTKIIRSGNCQAVLIPTEFRLQGNLVEIFKQGDELIIKPKPANLGIAFRLMGSMPADFMNDCEEDELPQTRNGF